MLACLPTCLGALMLALQPQPPSACHSIRSQPHSAPHRTTHCTAPMYRTMCTASFASQVQQRGPAAAAAGRRCGQAARAEPQGGGGAGACACCGARPPALPCWGGPPAQRPANSPTKLLGCGATQPHPSAGPACSSPAQVGALGDLGYKHRLLLDTLTDSVVPTRLAEFSLDHLSDLVDSLNQLG